MTALDTLAHLLPWKKETVGSVQPTRRCLSISLWTEGTPFWRQGSTRVMVPGGWLLGSTQAPFCRQGPPAGRCHWGGSPSRFVILHLGIIWLTSITPLDGKLQEAVGVQPLSGGEGFLPPGAAARLFSFLPRSLLSLPFACFGLFFPLSLLLSPGPPIHMPP